MNNLDFKNDIDHMPTSKKNGEMTYLEFIVLIFGPFMEWPVISKSPDVVNFIKTLDVIWNAFSL